MTCPYCHRWLRKLEMLESEGVKVIHVQHLMKQVAKRCAEIADGISETNRDDPAWTAASVVAAAIREEFKL